MSRKTWEADMDCLETTEGEEMECIMIQNVPCFAHVAHTLQLMVRDGLSRPNPACIL